MDNLLQSEMEVRLTDLRFHAHHGVMEQERVVGNEFRVDVSVAYNHKIGCGDNLDATISYADIYDIVKAEMAQPRQLLETVAIAIANGIMARWDMVNRGQVTVYKPNAPITGMQGEASVRYFFEKSS